MARPKRKNGFRRIVIDGADYVWRAGFERTGGHGDLEVLLDGTTSAKGSRLSVMLVKFVKYADYLTRPLLPTENADHLIACEVTVTPRLVARIVKDALSQGWQPSELLAPWFRRQVVIENGEPISYSDL